MTDATPVEADKPAKPVREQGRPQKLVGSHSPTCKRGKHEDWQHGWHGCAVGPDGPNHCDCTAHWVEERPAETTRFGQ